MYKKLKNSPFATLRHKKEKGNGFFRLLIYTVFICIFYLSFSLCSAARAFSVCEKTFAATFRENGGYARIITEDTPFYSDASGKTLLFYLPYTYYVKVLEEGAFYTHVECYGTGGAAAIDGFVPSDMLYYDGLCVKNPYAEIKLTTLSSAVLYSDSSLTTALQYVFSGRTLNYYGALPLGENSFIYFVGYNDRLGYVKESDVMPFTLENHPNELTFIPKEEPEPAPSSDDKQDESNSKQPTFALRVLIIASLLFAGITALFVAFRKKPEKHAAAGYYDENDYE